MECAEEVGFITRNRAGRGGGVAIAFKKTKMNMKEFKLPNNKYEAVCALGNTTKSSRKIALISVYIPPTE